MSFWKTEKWARDYTATESETKGRVSELRLLSLEPLKLGGEGGGGGVERRDCDDTDFGADPVTVRIRNRLCDISV